MAIRIMEMRRLLKPTGSIRGVAFSSPHWGKRSLKRFVRRATDRCLMHRCLGGVEWANEQPRDDCGRSAPDSAERRSVLGD